MANTKKGKIEDAIIKEEKPKQNTNDFKEEATFEEKKEEKDFSDRIKEEFDDVKDHSKKFTDKDKENGKLISIVAYLGILCLIPLLVEKDNKYVQFHAKEGLNLFIYDIIAEIACGILGSTLILFIPAMIVSWLVRVADVALMIVGIINVVNNEAKELPFIGKHKIIK